MIVAAFVFADGPLRAALPGSEEPPGSGLARGAIAGRRAVDLRPVCQRSTSPRASDNVASINATLDIALTGACKVEHMLDQYSASGGQLDFVRGAYPSTDGKSMIARTRPARTAKFRVSWRGSRGR